MTRHRCRVISFSQISCGSRVAPCIIIGKENIPKKDGCVIACNHIHAFDPAMLKKIGIKQLNLYASIDNAYFWTKYTGLDPEVGWGGKGFAEDNSKTPRSRSYTLSLSLGF